MNREESPVFPQDPGQLFKPLLVSMACLLGTCIVIVTYHLVLAKYCIWRRHQSSIDLDVIAGSSLATESPEGASPVGVDDKILKMIPVIKYSSTIGNPGFWVDEKECAVCLGELEGGDAVRLLPSCRHAFHVQCIDEWFLAHSSCPLCRSPVVAPVVDKDPGDDNKPATLADAIPVSTSSSHERLSNTGILRHCVSLVIPPVEAPGIPQCKKGLGLKRSFSMMDQSHVVIDIEKGQEEKATASSSSSTSSSSSSQEDRDLQERNNPISRFDQVSSRLIESFSQMRIGKTGCGNVGR